jgi:hypothetical protein
MHNLEAYLSVNHDSLSTSRSLLSIIAREPNRVTVSLGRVVSSVRVGFSEVGKPERVARVGHSMSVSLGTTPLGDAKPADLAELRAADKGADDADGDARRRRGDAVRLRAAP